MIGITKNPSRRIINVTWMSKRMGLQTPQYLSVQSKLAKISEGFKREICGFVEKKCKHSLYIRRFFVVRCICKLSIGGPPKKCRKTSFPSYFLLVMMPKIRQSTIKYVGLLVRWDEWLVNQVSDVPSIIFFSYFLKNPLQKLFPFIFYFLINLQK